MGVMHCKDCEFIDGLFNAKEDDFCSFASTEDNENADLDCDYKGVRCKDCGRAERKIEND